MQFTNRLCVPPVVALIGCLVSGASPCLAQARLRDAVGETVRVRSRLTPDWIRGMLAEANDTSVMIVANAPRVVPMRSIVWAERRTGRDHWVGVLLGLPIGLVLGGTTGFLAGASMKGDQAGIAALHLALIGGAIGSALGGIIGALGGPEQWAPVGWP